VKTVHCNIKDGPYCGPLDTNYRHSPRIFHNNATEYHEAFKKSVVYQSDVIRKLQKLSDDKGRNEVGIYVVQDNYSFLLKFYMYDNVTDGELDYPIASSFEKIYTTTERLVISFPNQVWLSQKRPQIEKRIDHLEETDTYYYFPEATYAYTTVENLVMAHDKPVTFLSFWLRLHRGDAMFKKQEIAARTVRILLDGEIVAEQTIVLSSDEWTLVTYPNSEKPTVGDTLFVQGGTDLDSIVISWGGGIPSAIYNQKMSEKMNSFSTYHVVESAEGADHAYSIQSVVQYASSQTKEKPAKKTEVEKQAERM